MLTVENKKCLCCLDELLPKYIVYDVCSQCWDIYKCVKKILSDKLTESLKDI